MEIFNCSFPMSCCSSRICLTDFTTEKLHHFNSIISNVGISPMSDGISLSCRQLFKTSCWRMGKLSLDAFHSTILRDWNFKNLSLGNCKLDSSKLVPQLLPLNELNSSLRTSRFGNLASFEKYLQSRPKFYIVITFRLVGRVSHWIIEGKPL